MTTQLHVTHSFITDPSYKFYLNVFHVFFFNQTIENIVYIFYIDTQFMHVYRICTIVQVLH